MRRAGALGAALVALALLAPAPAGAHGLVQRADLPIPEWLFGWAAAAVLIVSFAALAVLWPRPKLEGADWRPLPGGFGRALASPPVEVVAGAIGVFFLGVVVWTGLAGDQVASANFAPTFVYVIFWVGLVPASVLLGDIYHAFNPWRAIGRATGWVARRLAGDSLPDRLEYPRRLGIWPAAAGLLVFTWMELAWAKGDVPETIALMTLAYSAAQLVGMALYGVEPWIRRAEAFGVYFNLFSRLSPIETREGRVGLRRPLSGLTTVRPGPGTVPMLAVMIGTVTYDGFSAGKIWGDMVPEIASAIESLGFSRVTAPQLADTLGLVSCVLIVYAFYRLGIAGARSVGGDLSAGRLRGVFVHSLVPIAVVYVAAHYLTLLVFQGQAIGYLASDPLGRGWNLFGTADTGIDFSVLGQNTTWYLQVGFVVAGHVAALTLAHDRALVVYEQARVAVRSQYWMLAIMVGFTTLALWLLASANA